MSSNKKYRAAAIGRTNRGNFGHGLDVAYQGLEQVEFVAVADEDAAGRLAAQEKTGAPRSYQDYQEMLKQESLDIVSVGPRWPDCHVEMVSACLDAGAHVYCEKPIAQTLADGDLIVARAQAAGKKVAVSHQGVYMEATQQVKRFLEEGGIGQVQAIHAHGKQDRRGGGEDMMVLGTHLFNMMRFFVGPVDWMSAHITHEGQALRPEHGRQPTEPIGLVAGDCVNSYFAFKSGVIGTFDSRRNQGGGPRMGMEIIGSEGILSLQGGSAGDVMHYPYPALHPAQTERVWQPLEVTLGEDLHSGNQRAIIDLIEAIEGDRAPISSAADAVAALEMILGAYEAQISGGRVYMPMVQRRHPLEVWLEQK